MNTRTETLIFLSSLIVILFLMRVNANTIKKKAENKNKLNSNSKNFKTITRKIKGGINLNSTNESLHLNLNNTLKVINSSFAEIASFQAENSTATLTATPSDRIVVETENTNSIPPLSLPEEQADKYERFFTVKNITCNSQNCPSPMGYCQDLKTCKCLDGFANFKTDSQTGNAYCQYEQKKQLDAFLLEFILGCGTGHFFIGHYIQGVIKLVLVLIIIFLLVISSWDACEESGTKLSLPLLIAYILLVVYLEWALVDCILFGMNKYTDDHGIPIVHW